MTDTVKPPFDPWTTPGGLGGTLDPAVMAAIRADLIANPLSIPITQIQGYQRTISGYVTGSGSASSENPPGSFTVTHTGTGTYSVAFARKFKTRPAVVGTVNSPGNGRFIIPSGMNETGFNIEIYNPAGTPTDEPFSFFVQGT